MQKYGGSRNKQFGKPLSKGHPALSTGTAFSMEPTLETTHVGLELTEELNAKTAATITFPPDVGQTAGSSTTTTFAILHTNNLPTRTLTVVRNCPILARRARPIAMDFHSEADKSISPVEYLRLNEPIASTEEEKQGFEIYNQLYKYAAEVTTPHTTEDRVIAELTNGITKLDELQNDPDIEVGEQKQKDIRMDSSVISGQEYQHSQQQDVGADPLRFFPRQQYWEHHRWQRRSAGAAFLSRQRYRENQNSLERRRQEQLWRGTNSSNSSNAAEGATTTVVTGGKTGRSGSIADDY